MVDLLAFIKEYYYLMVLLLVVVVLILEIIISKINIKNPSILSAIDKVLPDLIIAAEAQFQDGQDKLNNVVLNVENYISHLFNVKDVKSYEKYIKNRIEAILSCPQKKEGVK